MDPLKTQWLAQDEIPADLTTPIKHSIPGKHAVDIERWRRFQVALDYLGVPDPGTEPHQARLFVVLHLAFPNAFRGADKRGPNWATDRQNMELVHWIDTKLEQSKTLKSDASVIEDALRKKELLDRFPWTARLSVGSLMNRVSKGRKLVKEEATWFAERFAVTGSRERRVEAGFSTTSKK
jgi:hypothetical protein